VGPNAAEAVIEAMCAGVEGNPLFLEERLSLLVETGALVKDGTTWYLSGGAATEAPEVLERLIRSWVDRLSPGPREVITSASVLGPEFGLSALAAVAEVEAGLPTALAELCATGLLTEVRQAPEPAYRFRHALIQEATYRGVLRADRRRLHARAAWGLEASSAGRLEEVAGLLGHHFVLAGEVGRAVHYLEMAGDHAAWAFANDEAVASYCYGLDLLGRERTEEAGLDHNTAVTAATEIRLKLTYVLSLMGRHSDAGETLEEGLRVLGFEDALQAARLHNHVGWLQLSRDDYAAAASAFEAALTRVGSRSQEMGPDVLDASLESQVGLAQVHYWRDEPDKIAAIFAVVAPAFKARGEPRDRQADYFGALLMWQLAERRHRVDEEVLDTARKGLAAAAEFCHSPASAGTFRR
jgi:hypothetical protein